MKRLGILLSFVTLIVFITGCENNSNTNSSYNSYPKLMNGSKVPISHAYGGYGTPTNQTSQYTDSTQNSQTQSNSKLIALQTKDMELKLREIELEHKERLAKILAEKEKALKELESTKEQTIKKLESKTEHERLKTQESISRIEAQAKLKIEQERKLYESRIEAVKKEMQEKYIIAALIALGALLLFGYLLFYKRQQHQKELKEQEMEHEANMQESKLQHEKVSKILDIIADKEHDIAIRGQLTSLLVDMHTNEPKLLGHNTKDSTQEDIIDIDDENNNITTDEKQEKQEDDNENRQKIQKRASRRQRDIRKSATPNISGKKKRKRGRK